jgi:hypothetical protein
VRKGRRLQGSEKQRKRCKMRASYDKEFRIEALSQQQGLVMIDLVAPGKRPGKRGVHINVQHRITREEFDEIWAFWLKFMDRHETEEPGSKRKGTQ